MTSEPRSDLHGHDSLAAVRGVWCVDAVRSLGLTISVEVAASILGISRTKAYALAKDGDFPVNAVTTFKRRWIVFVVHRIIVVT
jgi:hypothetical protein